MSVAGSPKITSDLTIRDLTVRAGEPFTIRVPFYASPRPHPTWSVGADEIFPDDRIRFDTRSVEGGRLAERGNVSGRWRWRYSRPIVPAACDFDMLFSNADAVLLHNYESCSTRVLQMQLTRNVVCESYYRDSSASAKV